MTPHWLGNAQINREKWDSCVASANLGLMYARCWYLDIVSPGWGALVYGDYAAVMPIPIKRFLGILPQAYQPLLCQQLGIFYDENIGLDDGVKKAFFENIPQRFWHPHLSVHNKSIPTGSMVELRIENGELRMKNEEWRMKNGEWRVERKPNFVLRLNKPHLELALAYSSHHRRCVRKALNAGVVVMVEPPTPQEMMGHVRSFQENKGNPVPGKLYPVALKIMQEALARKEGHLYAARDAQGHLLAAIFYLHYQGRLINLLNVTLPAGRAVNAMHALTDAVVRRHAKHDRFLDFEGSSIPSLARFYEGFGAKDEGYWGLSRG